jgi:hypothetical protein
MAVKVDEQSCPYCGVVFEKPPQRGRKYHNCGKQFYVRTSPFDGERYIITEDEAKRFEEEWDRRSTMMVTKQPPGDDSTAKQVTEETSCRFCKLTIHPDEYICVRCGGPVDGRVSPTGVYPFYLDLDELHPIEKAIIDLQVKMTDKQMLDMLTEQGLDICEHDAYQMCLDWYQLGENFPEVRCTHKTHNTPEKQATCFNELCKRKAVHTIWYHLRHIRCLEEWEKHDVHDTQFAMWCCNERHGTACAICRSREGVLIPTTLRVVPVLHPGCSCWLASVNAITLPEQISGILNHIADDDRKETIKANLVRCGIKLPAARTIIEALGAPPSFEGGRIPLPPQKKSTSRQTAQAQPTGCILALFPFLNR